MQPEERADVRLVAQFSEEVLVVVRSRCSAIDIWITDSVATHYRDKHAGQFDNVLAEVLLPKIVADPLAIYRGGKQSTLVFIDEFDAEHYIVVPITLLPAEAWIETLYVDQKQRFHRRAWTRSRGIYAREG